MSIEEFPKSEELRLVEALERHNQLIKEQNRILSNISTHIRDISETLIGGL